MKKAYNELYNYYMLLLYILLKNVLLKNVLLYFVC